MDLCPQQPGLQRCRWQHCRYDFIQAPLKFHTVSPSCPLLRTHVGPQNFHPKIGRGASDSIWLDHQLCPQVHAGGIPAAQCGACPQTQSYFIRFRLNCPHTNGHIMSGIANVPKIEAAGRTAAHPTHTHTTSKALLIL